MSDDVLGSAEHPVSNSPDGRRRILTVLGVTSVAVLAVVGMTRSSAPSSTPLPAAQRVVLVSVPGLRWQDLDAIDTPHLDSLLNASALLSVRSIGPETSLVEGYLAFGAGNRLESPATDDLDDPVARCLPELLETSTAEADDDLNGAEPGALGAALRAAHRSTAVFGSTAAVAALMGGDGCVDHRGASTDVSFDADVTLVELLGLEHGSTAGARAAALEGIDAQLGRMSVPDDATVIVFAPAATDDQDEVLVAGVRDLPAGQQPVASLVSPSTRRSDYVQLIDLGPTVLDVFGLELPESMSGTAIRVSATDALSFDDRAAALADTAERVAFRDRAVGPVSVVLVVLTAICGFAGLARRSRLARTLAPVVAAYLSVVFLLGLVEYHHLPLDFVVVVIPVLSAGLAAVVVAFTSRWGAAAPVTALIGALWLMMIVDVVVGGSLQINTPLGYSPTVAGRFQGFGNLSFGLVGAASVAVALVALMWPNLRIPAVGWAAWVGSVTAVAVAAPAFGADVGGTLALVPAFAGILSILTGRRISVWRAVLVSVATLVAVAVLAVIDRSRSPESRTHLGRFLDSLLDGDGGLIIRRKLHGNLSILTSSFWSFVLIAVLALIVVLAWRRRAALAGVVGDRPAVRAFLTGFAIMAVLGFALNDSGLAVPAIMCTVAVPWLVATMVPVVRRAGR